MTSGYLDVYDYIESKLIQREITLENLLYNFRGVKNKTRYVPVRYDMNPIDSFRNARVSGVISEHINPMLIKKLENMGNRTFVNCISHILWYYAPEFYGDQKHYAILKLSINGFDEVYVYLKSMTTESGFEVTGQINLKVAHSLKNLLIHGVDNNIYLLIEALYL